MPLIGGCVASHLDGQARRGRSPRSHMPHDLEAPLLLHPEEVQGGDGESTSASTETEQLRREAASLSMDDFLTPERAGGGAPSGQEYTGMFFILII